MPQTRVMPTKQSLGEVVGTVPCSWKARSGAGGIHLLFLLMLMLTLSEKLSVAMTLPSCSVGK